MVMFVASGYGSILDGLGKVQSVTWHLRLVKDFTQDVSGTVPDRVPQNMCCPRC